MNLILFGPPGAGKGTQARLLQERYNLALIATGDLCRDEVKKQTAIGKSIKDILDAGKFPSDEIILQLFESRYQAVKGQGVILDGIPRTMNQVHKLEEYFASLHTQIDAVLQLAVDDDELIRRLSSRVICKNCGAPYTEDIPPKNEGVCDRCSGTEFIRRADDQPSAIKTRLDIYNEQTKPLLQHFEATGKLVKISGEKSVEEVSTQIDKELEKLQLLTSESGSLYSAQDI